MTSRLSTYTLLLIAACLMPHTTQAQAQSNSSDSKFHLDVSGIFGSQKLGFELSTPVTKDITVRAGATFYTFSDDEKMNLPIQTGAYDPTLTSEENQALSASRFSKVNDFIKQFSGFDMDSRVQLKKKIKHDNFHLLVDITPFRNKHWYLTAGFYYGNSQVTEVLNQESAMTTLMGMSIWNTVYEKVMAEQPIIDHKGINVYLPYDFEEAIRTEYGEMAMEAGTYKHDIIATEDILWDYSAFDPITGDILHEEGDVRYHKGDIVHHQGDTYYITPNNANMFRLNQHTSKFKPYVGAGYRGRLTKDGRSMILVDMGVMYIGSNNITFHDGMRLGKDVSSPLFSDMKYGIYRNSHFHPSLSVRFTYRLF